MNLRKGFSLLVLLPALGLSGLLLAFPKAAADGFAAGASLCVEQVLPALFPFMVVCNLLVSCPASVLFGVPLRPLARFCGLKNKYAPLILLLSWFGGYVVCAQSISQYQAANQITRREAALLLLLGCCSSPGFVIGCVGGLLLGSVRLGALLYGLQLVANFLSAACIWPFYREKSATFVLPNRSSVGGSPMPAGFSFSVAIAQAVNSSLVIAGCLIFFQVVSYLVLSLLPSDTPVVALVCRSMFEISAGCAACAQCSGILALRGVAACLSLLGFSVLAQIAALLKGNVPLLLLIISRILHLFWMQALLGLLLRYLPGVASVYRSMAPRIVVMSRTCPDAAILLFIFICAILYKITKSTYNSSSMIQ